MRLRITPIVLALVALLAAAPAASARDKIAVLGIEPVDNTGPQSAKKTAALAKWLTGALRDRASRARAEIDIAPNSNKELTELKLIHNCWEETRDCMATIGKSLSADKLLYGKLERRESGGYSLALHLLDVGTGNFVKQKTGVVPDAQASRDGMEAVGADAFSELTGIITGAVLVVQANVATGTVYIDGEPRGALTGNSATLRGLNPGTVAVTVESPGYEKWEGETELEEGKSSMVTITMVPKGDGGIDTPGGDGRGTYKTLTWTAAVLTAGGAVALTINGLKVLSLEDDKDKAIEASRMGISETDCVNNPNCIAARRNQDACAEADQKGYKPVQDICDEGNSRKNLQNFVLWPATGVLAAATVFFAYKGYFSDDERDPASVSGKKKGPRVLVAPTIVPDGAGIGAIIQF